MYHNLELTLEMSFSSRWHTGSGEGNIITDRLMQKDVRNRPYIPGSTLKGVVREACEKLSRTLAFPEPSDPHGIDLSAPGAFVPLAQAPSPVDRLFGNRFEEGGLFFRNARLMDGMDDLHHPFFSQTRVRMNRRLGTARDQHLFSTEYGVAMKFKTTVSGHHKNLAVVEENDPPYAYCLLVAAIGLVGRLGGDKSTGAGRLPGNIVISRMVYNSQTMDVNEYLGEKASFYLDADGYQEMRIP